jgi:ATP-dependent helicase/nuclease subunit B
MGLLGLIAENGSFKSGDELISHPASEYEYWSLAKKQGEFGYVDIPMKVGNKRSGLTPDEFLPRHEQFLDEAIGKYIAGTAPFTAKENPDYPGYSDYDQLMRLEEWAIGLSEQSREISDAGASV